MTPDIVTTELPIEDVYPNPKHYREVRSADVKTLAASIDVAGQLDPITVFRDGDVYIVDAGHHRLEAMKSLGRETIRAIVLDDVDEAKSATIMTASNMHFAETELERSKGTQLLLTTGVRPKDVAALVGVDQNTVSQAAKGLKIAKDYAEDMTLDRLAVLPEFDGDEEAQHKIMTAGEDRWRTLYNDLKRVQRMEKAYAEAVEIVKASKVKLIERAGPTHEYLDRGTEKPKGAKYARIYKNEWSGTVDITWFRDAKAEKVDPEEEARKEKAALMEAQLEDAKAVRIEFLCNHLTGNGAVVRDDTLKAFAQQAWEDGIEADKDRIHEGLAEVTSFVPRVHAAVLSRVDNDAQVLMTCSSYNFDWYCERNGEQTVAYFKALQEVDYKPSEAETAKLAEIEAELAKASEPDPCDECDDQECDQCEHGDGDE